MIEKTKKRAVSLFALIVTIVIMIILTGTTILIFSGEDRIIDKSKNAQSETNRIAAIEQVDIAIARSYGSRGKIDYTKLQTNLNKIQGITQLGEITSVPIDIDIDGLELTINSDFTVSKSINAMDDYQLFSYIITDGNSYIDLGHAVPTTHKFQMKCAFAGQSPMFGAIDGTSYTNAFYGLTYTTATSPSRFSIYANHPTNSTSNSYNSPNTIPFDSNFHIISSDGNFNFYTDGIIMTQIRTKTLTHWTPINHAILFGRRTNSGIDYATAGSKFSYYKEEDENGRLLYNLVAAKRKKDNAIGMYDTVNKVFYSNAGNGRFSLGLSNEYQEVEYIQSSGTQYINTEYQATINTKIYVKVAGINNIIGSANIAGAGNGGQPFDLTAFSSANSYGGRFGQKSTTGVVPYVANEIHEFELSNGYFKCDGTNYDIASATNITSGQNIYLFGSTPSNKGIWKMYRVKIYDNYTLVRDMIPCYRKLDNKAGLYDSVNNIFYTDVEGGNFTIGNNV